MKILVFSSQSYEKPYIEKANADTKLDIDFIEAPLSKSTAILAKGYSVVCCFCADHLDKDTIILLREYNVKLIALRMAGFNNVDMQTAQICGIKVVRVPAYSPYSIAEFTLGLMLVLNRKIHRAYTHVREQDFSLKGLMGFDLHGKTVGIIGTGTIGAIVAKILNGFGCKLLATDPIKNDSCVQLGVRYVSHEELYRNADIITLHCPLLPATQHLINHDAIDMMQDGVMLINTGRGALIDTKAVIQGLKSKKIGYLGLDVYEEEENLFFANHSQDIIDDDVFSRLLTFPNVVITGHQAFFTHEAMTNIAATTINNIVEFSQGNVVNEVII